MSAKKASVYLSNLREARLTGDGQQTLKEQREQAIKEDKPGEVVHLEQMKLQPP